MDLAMWYALVASAAAQAPPPLPPDARFALALFCNPTCDDAVVDTLDAGLAAIPARSGFPDRVTRPSRIMGMAGSEFGMPDAAFIEMYGVGVDRPEDLAKSQEVLLAWIAAPRESAADTLAVAHSAFAAAAAQSGGWVEDLDTQRVFGAAAWRALDPKGPITDWFVVDAEPEDEADAASPLRLVTRGLRRYGDHDLVVEDVAGDAAGDVSFVVNAIAEALHGRTTAPATLQVNTATVRGTARLQPIARLDTDPEGPLLQLRFDGEITLPPPAAAPEEPAPPAADAPAPIPPLDASAAAAIPPQPEPAPTAPGAAPLPPSPEPLVPTSLEDAQREARERFARDVRPAFERGLPPGEVVAVKAPFRTRTGGTEYMWVELRSVSGDELRGVLVNEPYEVAGLKKGDAVTLSQRELFDYVWRRADGSREGNGTSAFLN
jgi:hypothetical protein